MGDYVEVWDGSPRDGSIVLWNSSCSGNRDGVIVAEEEAIRRAAEILDVVADATDEDTVKFDCQAALTPLEEYRDE